MFKKNSIKIRALLWVVVFFYPPLLVAQANLVDGMIQEADLVFEGAVTSVDYKMSRIDEKNTISVPFTFVTYEVFSVIKGNYPSHSLMLRFEGGPLADGKGFMYSAGDPLFDVGDHDILFVSHHLNRSCPLVGCSRGRFRVFGGAITNDYGLIMDPNKIGKFSSSQAVGGDDIDVHRVNGMSLTRSKAQEDGDLLHSVDELSELAMEGKVATVENVSEKLIEAVEKLYEEEEKLNFPLFESADIYDDNVYVDTRVRYEGDYEEPKIRESKEGVEEKFSPRSVIESKLMEKNEERLNRSMAIHHPESVAREKSLRTAVLFFVVAFVFLVIFIFMFGRSKNFF